MTLIFSLDDFSPRQRFTILGVLIAAVLLFAGYFLYSVFESRIIFDRADRTIYKLSGANSAFPSIKRLWPPYEQEIGNEDGRTRIPVADDVYVVGPRLALVSEYVYKEPGGDDRRIHVFRFVLPNQWGGFDMSAQSLIQDASEQDIDRYLAFWRSPQIRKVVMSAETIVELKDDAVVDLLEQSINESTPSLSAIEKALANSPNDPVLLVMALDAAMLNEDEAAVKKHVAAAEQLLLEQRRPLLLHAQSNFTQWLESREKSRTGENAYDGMKEILVENGKGGLKHRLEEIQALMAQIEYDSEFLPPVQPVLYHPDQGNLSAYLNLQVVAKLLRVKADFDLFMGDPEGALQTIMPVHRFATAQSITGPSTMDNLMGMAIRQISTKAMENAYLNGMTRPQQIKRQWPLLDEAYKADMLALKPNAMKIVKEQSEKFGTELSSTFLEQEATAKTTHAKMALLHSATAVRYHLLSTGDFPASESKVGELLPGGLDVDPHSDKGKPLKVYQGKDEWILYSVGPDGRDQRAQTVYDPTNGTTSDGDIVLSVGRTPQYPFPEPGKLGTTRGEILAQFPNGFSPDPFASNRDQSYTIVDGPPMKILSWGPNGEDKDGSETGSYREEDPAWATTPNGGKVSFPKYQDGPQYDPTNGIFSKGTLQLTLKP